MKANARLAAIAAGLAGLALAGLPLFAAAAGGAVALAAKAPAPMVAAPMKSNGSGVAVSWRIDGTPKAGAPLSIALAFDGVTDPGGATVRLATDGGLALAGADSTLTLPSGSASNVTIPVLPGASGIGYLHVFTTQNGSTSVVSVPVQVGQAPSSLASPAGLAKQTPSGEKILPMQVK